MTTIKSMYDKKLDITPSADFPGWVGIKCEDGSALHAAGHHESRLYTTSDLAAALGLVTREEVKQARATARATWERAWKDVKAERDALRAELDEAEATIARVKAAIEQSSTVDCAEIWIALDPRPASKQVILTADMAGVKVNGYDFTKGVIVALPAEDADRLISAGLAKETTDE